MVGCLLGAICHGTAAEQPAPQLPILSMPGEAYAGPLPPPTAAEQAVAKALESDTKALTGDIGERNLSRAGLDALRAAERFLEQRLREAGYAPERQTYEVRGQTVANIIGERAGGTKSNEIVIAGAHYDSVPGCRGANDNGSGVAATLALAQAFANKKPVRTLRFVFFVNEEPPWFQTADMGSLRYARRCKERREKISAMFSLETLGYYSDAKGSQKFDNLPALRRLYPDTGNFVAFVANVESGALAQQVVSAFRKTTRFPAYGCALPDGVNGIGWSDHWAFAQMGYPSLMVTDTALFRYPYYHTKEDTSDKLDFDRMSRVVGGLERVLGAMADDEYGGRPSRRDEEERL